MKILSFYLLFSFAVCLLLSLSLSIYFYLLFSFTVCLLLSLSLYINYCLLFSFTVCLLLCLSLFIYFYLLFSFTVSFCLYLRFTGDLCSCLLSPLFVSLFLSSLVHAISYNTTEKGNKTFIKIRRVKQQHLPWLLQPAANHQSPPAAAPAAASAAAAAAPPAAVAAAAAAAHKDSLAVQIASYLCAHVYE